MRANCIPIGLVAVLGAGTKTARLATTRRVNVDAWKKFAADLDTAGFWGRTSDAERQRLRDEVAVGASPFEGMEAVGWLVDGEDLAEGEVESLLQEFAPALADRGVHLAVETVEGPWDDGSSGYKIRINGIEVDLYRFEPNEPNVPLSDDPWTDCTLKPLAVINALLAEGGVDERIVVISPGGNDGRAFLLPLEAVAVLSESPVIRPEDRPVVPA